MKLTIAGAFLIGIFNASENNKKISMVSKLISAGEKGAINVGNQRKLK